MNETAYTDLPREAADATRRILWQRFVHADNQMFYDYWWGVPGFPHLPTPDQIAQEFPNAAGWGTGMENCALNAAQVLPGALLRHELAPDERTEHEARTLFQGLLRLFCAASAPGFLPRGLALDGVSHYPNSSLRLRYADLMTATANSVLARLSSYRQFDPQEHARLLAVSTWDWRMACLLSDEEPNHGAQYNARLRQLAPASAYEHEYVQGPWEAAHILSLSEAPDHHQMLREHLPLLLAVLPCDNLALSWSIYDVESTYWMMVWRTGGG